MISAVNQSGSTQFQITFQQVKIMKTFVILAIVVCTAILVPSANGQDPCAGMTNPAPCRWSDLPYVCCCNKYPQCNCSCPGKVVVVDPTCLWTERQRSKRGNCVCEYTSCDQACANQC